MPPDSKIMQLLESFKIQLTAGRLFAKYADKQLENVKDIHTNGCPQCQWFYKSSSTF